ncbi:MAG: hypothetical protein M0Z69_00420 [Actinomycetota bacterium]|nr:hypothetical protein [Actinomycetota bacterium]
MTFATSERLERLDIAHRPPAATLIGRPNGNPREGGFTWAARFVSREEALVALLRRGLAVREGE